MTNKFEDLDLDMDEVAGDVQCIPESKQPTTSSSVTEQETIIAELPPLAPILDTPTDDDSYEEVLKRLDAHVHKGWFVIPETIDTEYEVEGQKRIVQQQTGRIQVHSVEQCKPEEFLEWVELVFPAVKGTDHKPEHYQELKTRLASIDGIARIYASIRGVMQMHGQSEFLGKKKDKVSNKDENKQ
jgi:hypothetical protein